MAARPAGPCPLRPPPPSHPAAPGPSRPVLAAHTHLPSPRPKERGWHAQTSAGQGRGSRPSSQPLHSLTPPGPRLQEHRAWRQPSGPPLWPGQGRGSGWGSGWVCGNTPWLNEPPGTPMTRGSAMTRGTAMISQQRLFVKMTLRDGFQLWLHQRPAQTPTTAWLLLTYPRVCARVCACACVCTCACACVRLCVCVCLPPGGLQVWVPGRGSPRTSCLRGSGPSAGTGARHRGAPDGGQAGPMEKPCLGHVCPLCSVLSPREQQARRRWSAEFSARRSVIVFLWLVPAPVN